MNHGRTVKAIEKPWENEGAEIHFRHPAKGIR
jgi:hypothetical protein